MLRDVLKTFLSSLTEREFDAPLLAMLGSDGFENVHFIHGSYEFGKDVIGQRVDPATGARKQYVIQSKAGDIGLPEWRAVRPQLEEAAYSTRAHPDFDAALPRVVVLVTTGRIKGQAPVDAQDFEAHLLSHTPPVEFDTWDDERIVERLSRDPAIGLAGSEAHALDAAVAGVRARSFTETDLERFSRRWTKIDAHHATIGAAAVEAAVLGTLFRDLKRLDLAALVSLHLLRAGWSHALDSETSPDTSRPELGAFAVRLFGYYVDELLRQSEPHLSTANDLARAVFDEMAIVTYPAIVGRITELFGVAALLSDNELGVEGLCERSRSATVSLVRAHPGVSRPVSDKFAVSLIPPTLVVIRHEPGAVRTFLRTIAQWLIDRHNPDTPGLGLGSIDEAEQVVVERLLGGCLESTLVDLRYSSYVATALLDLLLICREDDLYRSVVRNLQALRVIPALTASEETKAHWHRGGPDVWPQVRIDYPSDPPGAAPTSGFIAPHLPHVDSVALALVCRSRYDVDAVKALAG